MDHDGVDLLPLLIDVVQVKSLRKLEVELDGGTLVLPLEGVLQGDVYLGAVESAVTGVQLPRQT